MRKFIEDVEKGDTIKGKDGNSVIVKDISIYPKFVKVLYGAYTMPVFYQRNEKVEVY